MATPYAAFRFSLTRDALARACTWFGIAAMLGLAECASPSASCGSGEVNCAAYGFCCPQAQPYICPNTPSVGQVSCYATMAAAVAACTSGAAEMCQ